MFELKFETGGAAFTDCFNEDEVFGQILRAEECERILKDVSTRVRSGCVHGSVIDLNGNKVGELDLT